LRSSGEAQIGCCPIGGTGRPPQTAPPDCVAIARQRSELVYKDKRLTRIQQCIEVTGTIHRTKKENDGDDHIQLKVDPQFAGLLNF
jgi:hypothetical protein